ncbi:MAG: MscS Mechanosensitive ion channel [Frankiales bacterium]|nr:MscS Mechanosensitive ion channel [Frankiales bacterium]
MRYGNDGVWPRVTRVLEMSEVQQWFDDNGQDLVAHGLRVLLILALALVLRFLLHRVVQRVISTAQKGGVLSERRRQRAETLGSVLRSIASFTVGAVAGAMVMSELGLDLTPIIASAGVVGVAVGFGAQNLVKDFLTGMFMLLEDQYGVGDTIDAGPAIGTVESVSLRTTRLRDVEGTVWHIRNGEIARIGNKSQGWSRAVVDLPVALDTDLVAARALLQEVAEQLCEDEAYASRILGPPTVWGVQALTDGAVLRVVVRTTPDESGSVERELRERVLAAFAAAGISLALGQRLA